MCEIVTNHDFVDQLKADIDALRIALHEEEYDENGDPLDEDHYEIVDLVVHGGTCWG